jgi:outer membrane biosynthesis protein TonB
MSESTHHQRRRWTALGVALAFHGMLLLLLWLVVIRTPIPPFPEGGSPGLEVNFGLSDEGMGSVQPDESAQDQVATDPEPSERVAPRPSVSTQTTAAKILTQETNEASAEVISGKGKASNESQRQEVAPETKVTEPEPPRKGVALYKGKKQTGSTSGAQEGETGKPGDQGRVDGNRNARYHGNGGGGDGGESGNGTGSGSGDGGGVRFSLSNRRKVSLPIPKANFQDQGKVVVRIVVDPSGKVIDAKPGVKGSNTSNPELLEIARKAALQARFNSSDDAAEEQINTITYNFMLR